jgi:uncharacterized protein (DUF1330 family)
MSDSLEDRVRAVEDKLAIFHLIASHPPAADTGTDRYYREAFVADGEMDLAGLNERVVLVEFDSLDKALACHDTPAYKEALKVLGTGNVERDMRVVEGK